MSCICSANAPAKFFWPLALALLTCAAHEQPCATNEVLDMGGGLNLLQVNISVHSKSRVFPTTPLTEPSAKQSLLREVDVSEEEEEQGARAAVLTNRGSFTLQGTPTPLTEAGLPMTCNIPQCDRSDDCSGTMCCSTQMFEAVSEITGWMESNDIEYVLLAGTLLGAYRDNDIIPWTSDVDIGMFSKDVAKLIAQKDIPWNFAYKDSFTIPRGCEDEHPGFPGNFTKTSLESKDFCWGQDWKTCSYYIDIYVLDLPSHGGDIAKPCISKSFGTDGHLNTTTVEIRNKNFSAPLFIEDALLCKYGETWVTPDPDEKPSYG